MNIDMNKKNILIVITILISHFTFGQTVSWLKKPSYDELEIISKSVLKVKSGGRYGIINYDGNVIAPCSYTDVTPIHDGCALLLDGSALKGILSENGTFVRVDEEYYVDEYPAYSEGLLAVKNGLGKWGYLDKYGDVKIRFEYDRASYFTSGFAAVAKAYTNEYGTYYLYWYIDYRNQISYLGEGFNDDDLLFATSFSKSSSGPVSFVVTAKAKAFLRSLNGDKVGKSLGTVREVNHSEKYIDIDGKKYSFNYDWTLKSVEEKSYNVDLYKPDVRRISAKKDRSGKYDLRIGDIPVLSYQFDKILPMSASRCAVVVNNIYGILEILDGTEVALNAPIRSFNVNHHTSVPITLYIDGLPSSSNYRLEEAEITLSSGDIVKSYVEENEIKFNYIPSFQSASTKEIIDITYQISGLLYPFEQITLEFNYQPAYNIQWPTKVTLDSQHNAIFDLIIQNTSDTESDECEIIVDGKTYSYTFKPKESHSFQVRKLVDIQDEDQVSRNITVKIKEKGCPEYNDSRSVIFERYFINN